MVQGGWTEGLGRPMQEATRPSELTCGSRMLVPFMTADYTGHVGSEARSGVKAADDAKMPKITCLHRGEFGGFAGVSIKHSTLATL